MKKVLGDDSSKHQFTEFNEDRLRDLIKSLKLDPVFEDKKNLIELIHKKESVGKSVLVSLAAIIASLVTFLPSFYRF
jgi:hypothetical protein